MLYQPLQQRIILQEKKSEQLRQERKLAAKTKEKSTSLHSSIDVLKNSFGEYSIAKNPSELSSPLVSLLSLVQSSGLSLNGCTVDKDKDHGWYVQEQVHVNAQGSLKQLTRFFELISTASCPLIVCESIQLHQANNAAFNAQLKLILISLV